MSSSTSRTRTTWRTGCEILSAEQLKLPQVYLEHDPPREHPTDTKHPVDDPNMLLVHVTHFNQLMWDNNRTPTTVIEHGVLVPEGVHYSGEDGARDCGGQQPRPARPAHRRGCLRMRAAAGAARPGGDECRRRWTGWVKFPTTSSCSLKSHYRFFFNPIRYTSLGLAVCEAMMIGMPIIGLATTEMAAVDRERRQLVMWIPMSTG